MMRGQQTPSIFIMMFTTVAIFAIAAVPVATAGQSKAAEIADLGAAHEGGGALGINNHGQVVGAVVALNSTLEAFLYSDGVVTNLGTLGGSTSVGFGINGRGHVTGTAGTSDSGTDAFLYTSGYCTTLARSAARGAADMQSMTGMTSWATHTWRETKSFIHFCILTGI